MGTFQFFRVINSAATSILVQKRPGMWFFIQKHMNIFLMLDNYKWNCWVLVVGTFKILIATSKLPSPKAAPVYTLTPYLSLNKFMGIVKYLHTHSNTQAGFSIWLQREQSMKQKCIQ